MLRILAILLLCVENLEKLVQIARISHDSYQGQANCANFAQFAVDFVSSIFLCAKWKMVGEFCLICQKWRLFDYFGEVYMKVLYKIGANGTDFTSFTI